MNASGARSDTANKTFKDKVKKKTNSPDVDDTISVGEHGRYQIKSGRLGLTFVARAFPKPPSTARGIVAEASGKSREDAVAALEGMLDAREQRQASDRRHDSRQGIAVPSSEEFVEALRHIVLTSQQRAMLIALSLAGDDGITELRLARAVGYKSHLSAQRSLTKAAKLIATYLSIEPTPGVIPSAGSILGYRDGDDKDGKSGNWILHAELSEAVRVCLK